MARTLAALARGLAGSGLPALVRPGPAMPEVIPWRVVAEEAGALAFALVDRGLEPLEAVAILTDRPDVALPAAFGIWLAGGIVTYLDPGADGPALDAALALAECRFAFVGAPVPGLAGHVAALDLAGSGHASLLDQGRGAAAAARAHAAARATDLAAADVAAYAPVAGSPRLAKLTHGGILSAAAALGAACGLAEGERILSWLPAHVPLQRTLEAASAATGAALGSGPAGGGPEAAGFDDLDWRQICPTVLVAPCGEIEALARRFLRLSERPGFLGRRLASRQKALAHLRRRVGDRLRLVLVTGEPPSALARDVLAAMGAAIAPLFAVAEASGPVTMGDPRCREPATAVGAPLASIQIELAEDGEILLGGPGRFAGYLKDPAGTDRALLGGWFRTGERGEWSEGGLRLLGPHGAERILLTRVTAPDVEVSLRGHAAVTAALAVPGSPWSALVVPDGYLLAEIAGLSTLTAEEAARDPRVAGAVREAVEAHNALAAFEGRVAAYAIVPHLPHDALGHLNRSLATECWEAELASAIPARSPGIF